jgi:MOSC domain-containing protein
MAQAAGGIEDEAGDATVAVRFVLSAPDPGSLVSARVPRLELDFGGVIGDRHYGAERPSSSRQARYYPRGTMIRNRRQLTLVSVEELDELAVRMELPEVRPEWLGANVLVEGLAAFSALPIGTRLLFPGAVGLVCEGVNQPCRLPAKVLQEVYPTSRAQARFVHEATGRRGIVASVERPGVIESGARARVFLPETHTTRT